MKFLSGLFLSSLLLSVLLSSCSDNNADVPLAEKAEYFPLSPASYWTYINTGDFGESHDSLYVKGTENLNAQVYTDMDAATPVESFMTGVFSNSKVRITDTQLIINGQFYVQPVDGFSGITIPSVDFVLYDIQEPSLAELSNVEDEITQDYMGVPLVIKYKLKSVQGDVISNFPVGEQTFENVISSQIIINLTVESKIDLGGFNLSVPVLGSQDVLMVTNYYAEGTGLVFSEVLEQYELEDLSSSGIELSFPSKASSKATQSIDEFLIKD